MNDDSLMKTPDQYKISFDKAKGEHHWLKCNFCKRETNHIALRSVRLGYEDEEIAGADNYIIVACQGCCNPSFLKVIGDSEMMDGNGEYYTVQVQFPEVDIDHVVIPLPYTAPIEVKQAYNETAKALARGMPHLAAIGIRLIIELICKDQKAVGRDLFDKVDALVALNVLSETTAQSAHGLRMLGNDAVHEFKVKDGELKEAWQVVNLIVNYIYGSIESAEILMAGTRAVQFEATRKKRAAQKSKASSKPQS